MRRAYHATNSGGRRSSLHLMQQTALALSQCYCLTGRAPVFPRTSRSVRRASVSTYTL